MRMMPYQSFLLGYKPACFENLNRLSPDVLEELKRYPFHQKDENTAIFFQNETLKQTFLQQTRHLTPQSPEYHKVLGFTLGFPPKATEFYAHYYEWQLRNRPEALAYYYTHKVGYRYAGVMCEGHIDDLVENAEWLWNRYGVEGDMAIKVIQKPEDDLIEFSVVHRNLEDLLYVENQVRKVLEHNRKVVSEEKVLT